GGGARRRVDGRRRGGLGAGEAARRARERAARNAREARVSRGRGRVVNRFRACLWKEWREHRGVAVAIAIASFLLVLLFELAAPRRAHQREDDAGIAALL